MSHPPSEVAVSSTRTNAGALLPLGKAASSAERAAARFLYFCVVEHRGDAIQLRPRNRDNVGRIRRPRQDLKFIDTGIGLTTRSAARNGLIAR
jgi:hypothetical protein